MAFLQHVRRYYAAVRLYDDSKGSPSCLPHQRHARDLQVQGIQPILKHATHGGHVNIKAFEEYYQG